MELGVKQTSFQIEVLMKNLQAVCFNKCCEDLGSDELTMQEVDCADRCAWKYLAANHIINNGLERAVAGGPADGNKRKK
jgi:hypothetical protein